MSETDIVPEPRPDRGVGDAWILFLVCLALLLTVGGWTQALWLIPGLVGTQLLIILLPAILFVAKKRLPVLAGLRLNFDLANSTVWLLSIVAGAGAWGLAMMVHQLMERLLGPAIDPGLAELSQANFLTLLVVVALLPGICEECLFRGAIQGVLERRGRWFGVLVAAILFGLFHLDPWRILPAALLGLVFGWLTIRTRSIVPAIIGHVSNNTTALTVGYLMQDADQLPAWLPPVLAVVFVLSIGLIARLTVLAPDPAAGNPLASVPSGVPRPMAMAAGTAVVATGVMIAGIAMLFAFLVTTALVVDDALLPDVREGDTLVLFRQDSFLFDINQGDTISFHRGDEILSRKVIRHNSFEVIVRDGQGTIAVKRDEIIGKMVYVISGQ